MITGGNKYRIWLCVCVLIVIIVTVFYSNGLQIYITRGECNNSY